MERILEELQSVKQDLAEVKAGHAKGSDQSSRRNSSPDMQTTDNTLLSAMRGTSPKAGARVSIQDPDSFIMLTRMGIQWSRREMVFQGMPVFSTDQDTNLPLFSNTAKNKASGLCKYAVNLHG